MPYFSSGYPAIASGGVYEDYVQISLKLDTAPVFGVLVQCDAYFHSGDTASYPTKYEMFTADTSLPKYNNTVVGRCEVCDCPLAFLRHVARNRSTSSPSTRCCIELSPCFAAKTSSCCKDKLQ